MYGALGIVFAEEVAERRATINQSQKKTKNFDSMTDMIPESGDCSMSERGFIEYPK